MTEEQELTNQQKLQYSTTDIASIVRKQLKQRFPNCKFSVTSKYYAGGSSICLSLMKADFKIIREAKDWPQDEIETYMSKGYTMQDIESLNKPTYHQLNQFTLKDDWNPNSWCNGTFLTEKAHNVLREAIGMLDKYNWNNSDSQTDYYDVHFYMDVEIGRWDKPFEEGKE